MKALSKGSPQADVVAWQRLLLALGRSSALGERPDDGDYATLTTRATRITQAELGLTETGIADRATQQLVALEVAKLAARFLADEPPE